MKWKEVVGRSKGDAEDVLVSVKGEVGMTLSCVAGVSVMVSNHTSHFSG